MLKASILLYIKNPLIQKWTKEYSPRYHQNSQYNNWALYRNNGSLPPQSTIISTAELLSYLQQLSLIRKLSA